MEDQDDHLTTLPHELLHNIFSNVDPLDLAALSASSRALRAYLSDNTQLFKALWFAHLGEPWEENLPSDWDYKESLRIFSQARRILGDAYEMDRKVSQTSFITDFAVSILRIAHPSRDHPTLQFLERWFEKKKNRDAFLCQSRTFHRAQASDFSMGIASFAIRQASARLHCFFGVPILTANKRYVRSYPYAASMVYDLRNYTEETLWGPYLPDGEATVDWEKMEAAMIVLGHNLRELNTSRNRISDQIWTVPWLGASPQSFTSLSLRNLPESLPLPNTEDPYNVEGSWLRVVCFLDFHELLRYNFWPDQRHDTPRAPLNTIEAVGLIVMELKVTKIEAPGPDDGQHLPVVHFIGTSRPIHESWDPNENANINGRVRQTKDGEIRWTSISIHHGEERWKSEGIQVGGCRSARGVLGHWFDKDFDQNGPMGPTAFWKISNEIDNGELPNTYRDILEFYVRRQR